MININAKSFFKIFLFFFIILTLSYWYPYLNWFLNWVSQNNDKIRNTISLTFITVSVLMYMKLKLIDSKVFKNLLHEFGKTKLFLSLRIIAKLLEINTPEEIVIKLQLVSKVEIDMKKYASMLNDIFVTGEYKKPVKVTLTKKQEKDLIKKLTEYIKLIDRQLEEKKITNRKEFDELLKDYIKHDKNIREKYEKPLEEKAKKELLSMRK